MAGNTVSTASSTSSAGLPAGIGRPISSASSGSARGWISPSSGSGSPAGSSMSEVSRPKTGSWMPSASRLTLLVMPSLNPTGRSPARQRCRTVSACAA